MSTKSLRRRKARLLESLGLGEACLDTYPELIQQSEICTLEDESGSIPSVLGELEGLSIYLPNIIRSVLDAKCWIAAVGCRVVIMVIMVNSTTYCYSEDTNIIRRIRVDSPKWRIYQSQIYVLSKMPMY